MTRVIVTGARAPVALDMARSFRAAGCEVVLADSAWSSRAIRQNRPAPAFTAALLGNVGQGRNTLSKLHSLRTRNPDILLTPSHCAERSAEEES